MKETILQKDWIRNEIKGARKKGIAVFVEGTLCDEKRLDDPLFVQEELPYMIDFGSDSKGNIISMNFNKISQF